MKTKGIKLINIGIIVMLIVLGCGKKEKPLEPIVDKGELDSKAKEAFNTLIATPTDKNFQQIHMVFNEVLAKDPNNSTALLGRTITEILLTINDKETQELFEKLKKEGVIDEVITAEDLFGNSANEVAKKPWQAVRFMQSFAQISSEDPLQASDIQEFIEKKILPIFDNIVIPDLEKIKQNNFNLIIDLKKYDPEISEEERYIDLDLAEVYAIDSMAHSLRGLFTLLTVWSLDLDREKLTASEKYQKKEGEFAPFYNPLADTNYNFMGLRPDAKTKMHKVKIDFIEALQNMIDMISFVENESDNQKDDIVKLDEKEIAQGKKVFTGLKNCFKGENWIVREMTEKGPEEGQTPFDENLPPLQIKDNEGNVIWEVVINFGNFFDTAPELKIFLPTLNKDSLPIFYDKNGNEIKYIYNNTYPDFDAFKDKVSYWQYNDPTFGGLLPTLTHEKIKKIIMLQNQKNKSTPLKIFKKGKSNFPTLF